MHFEVKKIIVVRGSAGIGQQVVVDVFDDTSAVTVGRARSFSATRATVRWARSYFCIR